MNDCILHSQLLSSLNWLKHGFSVGASEICDLIDPSSRVFDTHQVHGHVVHLLDTVFNDVALNGDAFISSKPNLVCHIRTADCVPILIADTKLRVVSAIHAGWKGTVQDVVGSSIAKMEEAFGTAPSDCVAAIGPRICGGCYEVGHDVMEEMEKLNLETGWKCDDRHADLGSANRELLIRAGIPGHRIELLPQCTSCDSRFASWRRDHTSGRQISYIVILN